MITPTEEIPLQEPSDKQTPLKLLSLALSSVGLVILIWWQWPAARSEEPSVSVPKASLDGVHPRVAAIITEARNAVISHPNSARAWGIYGMVLRAHEYNAEAIVAFKQAETLDPNEFRWPYFRGDALELRDPSAAEEAFLEAYKRKSSELLPVIRIAKLRLRNGRAEEAISALEPVLDKKNPDVRIIELIARCHLMNGELQKCLECSRSAIRLQPKRTSALRLHAQIATRLKLSEEAATSLQAVNQAAGDDLQDVDQYRAEISQFRRDPRWYAFQAEQLIEAGKTKDAVELLREAVVAYPKQEILIVLLARTYVDQGVNAEAELVFKDGLSRFPNSLQLIQVRALQALLREQWMDAIRDLRLVLKHDPGIATARADLGFCLKQTGRLSEAVREFNAALASRPDLVEPRIQLAEIYLSQSKTKLAKQHIRQVLIQIPDHAKAKHLFEQLSNQSPPKTNCAQKKRLMRNSSPAVDDSN